MSARSPPTAPWLFIRGGVTGGRRRRSGGTDLQLVVDTADSSYFLNRRFNVLLLILGFDRTFQSDFAVVDIEFDIRHLGRQAGIGPELLHHFLAQATIRFGQALDIEA